MPTIAFNRPECLLLGCVFHQAARGLDGLCYPADWKWQLFRSWYAERLHLVERSETLLNARLSEELTRRRIWHLERWLSDFRHPNHLAVGWVRLLSETRELVGHPRQPDIDRLIEHRIALTTAASSVTRRLPYRAWERVIHRVENFGQDESRDPGYFRPIESLLAGALTRDGEPLLPPREPSPLLRGA